jgi:hypothetical protein
LTSLVLAAQTIGGYVWLEERLFEILGGWVPAVVEPAIKLRFAAESHHHAWHASLWRDRLPELAGMAPESFVGPADEATAAFVAALAASATTLEKMVGVYRVALPRQAASYTRHRSEVSPLSDAPTIRALELVLADELTDWREGEAMVSAALLTAAEVDRAEVDRADAHRARLEALLLLAGS